MFAAWAIAFLCFMPMSHSAPVDCNDLLKPSDQIHFHQLEGTWAMVADSMQITEFQHPVPRIGSVSVTLVNSTYTRAMSIDGRCFYDSHNVSNEGPNFKIEVPFNYTGTILSTSCADCVVLSLSMELPHKKSKELCLFSKRREVDPKELREFIAQVDCLNMPKPVVMDPNEGLCPVYLF
ncbi:hypothetical protein L3Q82_005412 [Scortum barcoo]|uniref:Uncharacterized protein n=1 Tax=Scortum barcoo TaxID=214431 RepID=A0ACB8VA52_9TELE|nr:hypothetical protein L3Q82_005412 [Scortum barcoo]